MDTGYHDEGDDMSAVDEYQLADSETVYTTPQQLSTARRARAAIAELEAAPAEATEKPDPWPEGQYDCSACGLPTGEFHWYPPDKTGFRLCPECNPGELRAALAERDKESIALLDAVFQTVDPEDGEEIEAEAFPKGSPAWVLAWYQEHPNEEEIRARAATPGVEHGYLHNVCYLCHQPIQPDQKSEEWEPGYRHFECPARAEEEETT